MKSFSRNSGSRADGPARLLTALIIWTLIAHATQLAAQPDKQQVTLQAYTQVRNAANLEAAADGTLRPTDVGTRLLRALMAEAGLDYQLTLAPWARNMQALKTQSNALAYSVVRTPEREDAYHWVGLVRRIDSYLYGLRERQESLPTTLEQARNYRIASIRDDAYDDLLHKLEFGEIVHINNGSPWLTLMERGRMDLIPFGEQAMADYLNQQGVAQDRVVPAVRLDTLSTGLYFALSKHTDVAIYERLRTAYLDLVANGTYERIVGVPHPDGSLLNAAD